MEKQLSILSVDALYDGQGWSWNNWWEVSTLTKEEFEKLNTNRKLLKYMRDNGYLSDYSKGRTVVYDDQYNICFQERNGRTVFAIEYGPAY